MLFNETSSHCHSFCLGCFQAFAWLMSENPDMTPKAINEMLCSKRNVRKTLFKQKSLVQLHKILTKDTKDARISSRHAHKKDSLIESDSDGDSNTT